MYQYPIVFDQYYLSSPIKNDVIYVYGLTQSVTQTELFKLFSQYGNVLRVDIIMDHNTGLSKGYAFVFMDEYDRCFNSY